MKKGVLFFSSFVFLLFISLIIKINISNDKKNPNRDGTNSDKILFTFLGKESKREIITENTGKGEYYFYPGEHGLAKGLNHDSINNQKLTKIDNNMANQILESKNTNKAHLITFATKNTLLKTLEHNFKYFNYIQVELTNDENYILSKCPGPQTQNYIECFPEDVVRLIHKILNLDPSYVTIKKEKQNNDWTFYYVYPWEY